MMINLLKKNICFLIAFIMLTVSSEQSYSVDNNILNKINKIDGKASNFINEYKDRKKKDTKLKDYVQRMLKNTESIENFQLRKDVFKQQIATIEDEYYNKFDKFYLYSGIFLSSIGYGIDARIYYKNFVGIGLSFTYQDQYFIKFINSHWWTSKYHSLEYHQGFGDDQIPGNKESNFETQSFILYLTLKPFRDGLHFKAGVSFSRVMADLKYALISLKPVYSYYDGEILFYTEDKYGNVSTIARYAIDNFSAQPFLSVGYDFIIFKNFTISIEFGLFTINEENIKGKKYDEIMNNLLSAKGIYNTYNQKIRTYAPKVMSTMPFVKVSFGYLFTF